MSPVTVTFSLFSCVKHEFAIFPKLSLQHSEFMSFCHSFWRAHIPSWLPPPQDGGDYTCCPSLTFHLCFCCSLLTASGIHLHQNLFSISQLSPFPNFVSENHATIFSVIWPQSLGHPFSSMCWISWNPMDKYFLWNVSSIHPFLSMSTFFLLVQPLTTYCAGS